MCLPFRLELLAWPVTFAICPKRRRDRGRTSNPRCVRGAQSKAPFRLMWAATSADNGYGVPQGGRTIPPLRTCPGLLDSPLRAYLLGTSSRQSKLQFETCSCEIVYFMIRLVKKEVGNDRFYHYAEVKKHRRASHLIKVSPRFYFIA